MFEIKKTLIVVYKDEMLMNQLKKMVETHDDTKQDIAGTRDDSINIISWTEKVWLGNKKAGNIQGKILFLGEIKGTDKLIPVIDIKFDEYGVKFGWAGNQAVVYADPKALTTREDYDVFLEKLSTLPVPTFLKETKERIVVTGTDQGTDVGDSVENTIGDTPECSDSGRGEVGEKKYTRAAIFTAAKKKLSVGADTMGKIRTQVASRSEEIFRNKSLMKQQMLFYGVIKLYYDGLEPFMNM